MSRRDRDPRSGPLGHRRDDPRHRDGDWHPAREQSQPVDQQGTGRPWSGARFGGER